MPGLIKRYLRSISSNLNTARARQPPLRAWRTNRSRFCRAAHREVLRCLLPRVIALRRATVKHRAGLRGHRRVVVAIIFVFRFVAGIGIITGGDAFAVDELHDGHRRAVAGAVAAL